MNTKATIASMFALFILMAPAIAKGTQKQQTYDREAKTLYSENDVKALVYRWFAGFDHQTDIAFFKQYLRPGSVDMHFPDFPVQSIADFELWYQNVIDTVQWNSHSIVDLKVSGSEPEGFRVFLVLDWKARTYQGEVYNARVSQEWLLATDQNKEFFIKKHRAELVSD